MTPLQIQYPIWASRSVGIAEHKIGVSGIDLEIMYKNKKGERLYPHVYHMDRAAILKYPAQQIRNGVKLRIVPIADLAIKEERGA